MSEYEYSITISRKPEQVFAFVSDAKQSPRYLLAIRQIGQSEGESVQAEIEIFGHRIYQEAYFRIDSERRRIDFGSKGRELFSGWLQVMQGPDLAASDLTVNFSFQLSPEEETQLRAQLANLDRMIQNDLKEALQSIKNICEGHGDPVNEADAAAPA